jgi:L-lactate dehydrogenase complex protein LldG
MDIDLPTMLLRVRGGGKQLNRALEGTHQPQGIPQPVSWGLRLFTWFASSPRRFAFAQKMAGLFSRIWSPRNAWLRLPAFTGWGYSKDFPRPAVRTFRDRWVHRSSALEVDQISDLIPGQEIQQTVPPVTTTHQSNISLVDQFQNELETLGGKFVHCKEGSLAVLILALLKGKNTETVLAWDQAHLPAGLLAALRDQGIKILHNPDPGIQVGITGAVAGIAETGTLVITSGNGKPQSASLLPEVHIAILREVDLLKDLAAALSLPEVQNASLASLVSGPSKTADIEMTLTVGVHGPGEVIVFLTR